MSSPDVKEAAAAAAITSHRTPGVLCSALWLAGSCGRCGDGRRCVGSAITLADNSDSAGFGCNAWP